MDILLVIVIIVLVLLPPAYDPAIRMPLYSWTMKARRLSA